MIAISTVLGLALLHAGDASAARRRLESALVLAEPEGYVRVFVDEGAALRPLLREFRKRHVLDDYVARLLAALDGDPSPAPKGGVQLTPREREILALLADGLSNRAIALQLVTSESTIKSHVHQVIGKFGVSTRAQVVVGARQQGRLT